MRGLVNIYSLLFLLLARSISAGDASFLELPAAADSAASTPFAVKVQADGVDPGDTCLEFCVWIYDQEANRYISQIWTAEGWKSGWTCYQPFVSGTGVQRTNWAYLRVYRPHTPDSFYISFKYRNGDTVQVKSSDFQILNMTQQGGWLVGTVYQDASFDTPYQGINVLARNAAGTVVGTYVSENNGIDEGNPDVPGRFRVAVPVGGISSVEFQDSVGNTVSGYTGTSQPWEIACGQTTWVDPVYIEDIGFSPECPEIGDTVRIQTKVCNPGEETQGVSLEATYKSGGEIGEIGREEIDILPGHSCAASEILWTNVDKGNYEIVIEVTAGQFKTTMTRALQVGASDILINEIMYRPQNSGEWLEIMNRGTEQVNMKGWSIDENSITEEDAWLSAGGFAVIAESTSQVMGSIYGSFSGSLFSLGSEFPGLRDAADTVVIRDGEGVVQDVLKYESSWASNSGKGVSLERISPIIVTNDPGNWNSCVATRGGTPGRANSIYAAYVPAKATLDVQPNVFSPRKEIVFISYTLPFTKALVRLHIYDRCGRCIRKLIDGEPSGAQSRHEWDNDDVTWSQVWDGKNDKDRISPMGIYVIYLEAKDQDSDRLVSQKTTVVVAK
jgi:hypothetical protein